MTEHVVQEPPPAPPPVTPPAPEAAHQEHHGHDDSPEAIKREIKRYLYVFGGLAVLTVITVAISRLHLPTMQAVILALVVATVKGSLVAAFFMHLISERKLIYAVLVLTVFFFGVMIWGPLHQRSDAKNSWPGYDLNASAPAPAATSTGTQSGSGSGH